MSELERLLDEVRADLESFVARRAGFVLRYEGVDDLLQGVQLRALERGRAFSYEGREAALKWVYAVARSYVSDRRAHWSALKRRAANLLRLTAGGTPRDPDSVREPAGERTGPSTFADRRERLAFAVKALALLPDRDRKIMRWSSEDVPLEEQAERLGISYNALKQARARALARYRKTYALVSGTTL